MPTWFVTRTANFIRTNGLFVFLCELSRRCGVLFRRIVLKGRFAPGLVLGPRCHIRGLKHIRVGVNFQAAEGLWLEAITDYAGEKYDPQLTIGNDVAVSRWSHIAAAYRVEIGDGVLIGSRVIITDHNHGQYDGSSVTPQIPPIVRSLSGKKVKIERNVWLGDGVVVAPGSEICEGAVIGANSVVTGMIPAFTIAVGAPARPVKRYDFDLKEWVRI
jgi:acetyltransferase-like isoleucine patch superfamily enzyme